MKKLLTLTTMFFALVVSSCSYDDTGIWDSINNLEQRVFELEQTCEEMNSNISAMQTILTALQNNDYVTSIVKVVENGETIGYTINFSKSGPVTIYHGENRKDGYTPVIGVRQDIDGIYYWTLDGKWLTDENGNKIKAVGADSKDGADGITPQLKIEDDYWFISFDNGATWTKLGKATGEDDTNGVDGDSFFSSVTYDEQYIYLTLSDGTEIVVPMVDNSSLADLKSVVFIPRYSDGKATITFNGSGDAIAEFDFMVAPANLASVIAENYESMLTISAVQTETRAANLINLPVISCTADENGIISFKVSCKQLDIVTKHYAVLTISDGKNSITSESVEMIVSDKQDYMVETDDFKVQVADIGTISAGIKVTPSKDSLYFCWRVMEYDGESTAEDIMNQILHSGNIGTYKGIQDYTVCLDAPDTKYCTIVFGCDGGINTTEPVMVVFRTLPGIGASETEFNMTASAITPDGFDINITSTEPSTYYTLGVCLQSEWNETKLVEETNAYLAEIIEMQQQYGPTTIAEILSMYFYRGARTVNVSDLTPETTYMGYIFTIDHKTGRVVKTHTFNPLATTTSLLQFKYCNLQVTHAGFTVDVIPTKGEESFWGYYVWTKEGYEATLQPDGYYDGPAEIVMRSYWGLNNIGLSDYGLHFDTFIKEYVGQYGSSQISSYEPLKNDTEYVVVLFYMDPEALDPTVVYDYNYVAVEFKTLKPSADEYATLEVTSPSIEVADNKYNIHFNVKTNDKAADIKVGAQLWANYDFAKYWDENDWSQIQAFFLFRQSVGAESLAAAKTEEGATISLTGLDKEDYVFFFEVLTASNTPTQYAIRVEPSAFEAIE